MAYLTLWLSYTLWIVCVDRRSPLSLQRPRPIIRWRCCQNYNEKRSVQLKIDSVRKHKKWKAWKWTEKYLCICVVSDFFRCYWEKQRRKEFVCTFSTSLFRLFANQYLSFFDIEFPEHRITVISLLVYVFVSDLIAHARLFFLHFLENAALFCFFRS